MGHPVEEKAVRGPARDDRHRHPSRGHGMPKQIERAHVRGGDDDALSALARFAEYG